MRNLVLLCLLATGAQATIQNVSVLGTTATQALIHYTAPNNSPCNIEVSESPTYRPLVHDVDGTLFASAASDTRPGSVTNGAERLFAVGKRAAEVALDTARYSRALQTATQHYFRITCPSTGDQATGTFQTNTILFGQGYAEPEASDPNRPGSYAYPTLSTNDRTQAIVDPQTGLLIKRLSLPKQTTANPSGVPFPTVRASAWNNLTNLQAADGQAATVSGATGPLFMGLNSRSPYLNSFMYPWAGAYQGTESAFGYYQVHVVAAVNPGGNAPSNPDDATIVVCLTYDGAACYPGSAQYQARLTTGMSDTAFGTTNTVDLWQATPGTTLPNWPMMSERNGNVSCDGSPTVTLTAGQPFGVHWGPGSNLNINGADYPIATIAHTAKLTLAVNCPTSLVTEGAFDAGSNIFRTVADTFQPSDVGRQIEVVGAGGGAGIWLSSVGRVIDARTILTNDGPQVTGVTTQFGFTYGYVADNFGVLISKKTASPDTIAVDYAYVNYELDFYEQFVDQGGLPLCGTTTVTGANGRPGYSCVISGGQMYWVDAASAETHFLGLLSTNSPDAGCGGIGQLHDAKDPDTFYCGQKGPIYSVKYYGNHLEPTALNPGGDFGIFQSFPNCDTSKGKPPYTNQQPCLVTTLLTPGTDVIALAGAFSNNPQYPPAMDTVNFRTLWFNGADENGDLLFNTYRGANDTLGWFFVFRPSATSNSEGGSSTGPAGNHGCVGAGHPGCIIAAMTSWASKGCRWCPIKGVGSPYPGWMYIGTYGWTNSQPGSGPYYVPVVDGTPNGTLNYLDGAASLIDCPANQFGATGHNCSKLTVGSEPLSPPHGAGETGLPGELGPAMLGDYFATQVQLPINSAEQMMLIAKTPGAVPGTWVYTLWRKINSANGANYATTGPNPSLYTVCGANQYLADQPSGESVLWNFLADPHGTNSTGQTIPPQPNSTLGHPFYSHGNYASNGTPNTDHRCAAGQYACYSTVLLNNLPFSQAIQSPLPTGVMVSNPGFGQTGAADYTNIQAHPTGGGETAPPDRFNYMFDGRPYYGGFSSGSVTGSGSNPATLVGGQLYYFPKSSMPNISLPFRKVYPTAAFSGQLPLVDVSSPALGNVIGTGSADSYKYCVAAAPNECRQGSLIGDVYVNAPNVRYPFCYQAPQDGNLGDEYDICIGGQGSIRDSITQIDMTAIDNEGFSQRVLTKYRRARVISIFDTPYVLPNGQWMVFEGQFVGDGSLNKSFFIAKIPPPAPKDSYNRLDFIPISITLPPLAGATQAFIRFGYAENGTATSLYCTTRKESCVVGTVTSTSPVDPLNPFYLEQTEATSWTAAACASGCTINVPGIPQRILYYQFVYKNSSGIVYTSPVSSTIVP